MNNAEQCVLTCEGIGAPNALLGNPIFTWHCTGADAFQSHYRLQVRDGEQTVWDSGWIPSAQSAEITYGGETLQSNSDFTASVTVRCDDGREIKSAPISFSTGLPNNGRWNAGWLASPNPGASAPMFRRRFALSVPIRRARLFITGLGYYETSFNGVRVGDHRLDPAWTDYGQRVYYATYDVTGLLHQGDNVWGVILGRGWYGYQSPHIPDFSAQLCVQSVNGAQEWLYTGSQQGWTTFQGGPIVKNSIYDGEVYDARLEKPGWDTTAFDEQGPDCGVWELAIETEPPRGKMLPQTIEPIRVVKTLFPVSIKEIAPGISVVDFGQNLAGVVRLRISCPAGTHIVLQYAELVNENGSVNRRNLGGAAATDEYISKGGQAVYEPRFTYHGFRYVEISGLPEKVKSDDICALCLRSDVVVRGHFQCADELVNRIQQMCAWTENNNLYGVPTDCPQRAERLGWLNDLTVRAEEAVYNFDMHHFYSKFIDDIADEQGPQTGAIPDTVPYVRYGNMPADAVCSSYLILPWLLYQHYADIDLLRRHYAGLATWVRFLQRQTHDGIVQYSYYGDWASPIGESISGSAGAGAVSAVTPGRLMSTGFLLMDARLMSTMATILGKPQDAADYTALAERTKDAFNRTFFNRETCNYATGSQAANAFALYLDITPPGCRGRVAENLAKNVRAHGTHLTTGNLCSRYILDALSDNGYLDLAYALATQTTYPSWGYMLACGATTAWERWEHVVSGPELGMASHDHPMNATISAWFYQYLAGIRVAAPGFSEFKVRPYPPKKLGWVHAKLMTIKGLVEIHWEQSNGRFSIDVRVPFNSRCKLELPERYGNNVIVDGAPDEGKKLSDGRAQVTLTPGRHLISAQLN